MTPLQTQLFSRTYKTPPRVKAPAEVSGRKIYTNISFQKFRELGSYFANLFCSQYINHISRKTQTKTALQTAMQLEDVKVAIGDLEMWRVLQKESEIL